MRVRGLPLLTALKLAVPRRVNLERPLHMVLAVCDHYEPAWLRPGRHVEEARVERWVREYPELARQFADSSGRPPQHTFFYPAEEAEYDDRHMARVAEICRAGFGDVEVHLHHHGESSAQLRDLLAMHGERLASRHGLLERDDTGKITYGFIHGNWALDNSRPDGRWCGVNDEITILRETGCYADFTMPSAPDPCQTRTINSIYYAIDDALRPKSHDVGIAASVGRRPPADGLLMIQGPLAFDWKSRKWGLLPRLENADLHSGRPPEASRLPLWLQAGVRVVGRDDWLFVKLHTHGAQESNARHLLGEPMRRLHAGLRQFAESHPSFRYYYTTAREMAGLVHQAEAGKSAPVVTGAIAAGAPPDSCFRQVAPCVPGT